jgi:hypothetical protein
LKRGIGSSAAPLRRLSHFPARWAVGLLAVCVGFTACDATVTPPDDRPTIGVSPRNVTLRTAARTPDIVSARVAVFNNGSLGSLDGLQVSITDGNEAGWLAVSEPNNGTIDVEATASGLDEGIYSATVQLALDNATNTPRSFTVTLIAGDGPVFLLSSDTVWFHNLPVDSGHVFVKSVALENSGGGQLSDVTIGAITYDPRDQYQDWLSVNLRPDTMVLDFTVVYGPRLSCRTDTSVHARLAGHLCSAEFALTSSVAANSPLTVTVLMEFDNEPTIFLSPKALAFTSVEGSPVPASQTVDLSYTGIVDLPPLTEYQVETPLDASGGLVGWVTASVVDSTVTVSADPTGIAAGVYAADIEVTHPPVLSRGNPDTAVLPDTIKVTLTVEPPPPADPVIALSTTSITVSATRSATVEISNGGDGVLDGLTVSGPDWLLAFLDSNAAPATLTVSMHPSIAPPSGTTSGQITISANQAPDVVVTVNIP